MSPLKKKGKKKSIKKIQTLSSKNLNLDILNLNPFKAIDGTKNKISNFYSNFQKRREREKIRLENKRNTCSKKIDY